MSALATLDFVALRSIAGRAESLDIVLRCRATQIIRNKVIPMEKLSDYAAAATFISVACFNRTLNMLGDRRSHFGCAWLTHSRSPPEFARTKKVARNERKVS